MTGSPWPIGNNPRGKYFDAPDDAKWISNGDYPLWQVVRASAAAPRYFDPETITISEAPNREPEIGEFVDGGVSPFNNPSLQALMYATLDGFNVGWDTGARNLLLVSVGTGSPDPTRPPAKLAATGAVKALLALMDDCAALVQTVMQWMSSSSTARRIDGEIGDLGHDLVTSQPLFTYLRYDLDLTAEAVEEIKPGLAEKRIETLGEMDEPKNLTLLKELGELAAAQQVQDEDFAQHFDLAALGQQGNTLARRRKYQKKMSSSVVAVQLDLDTDGFTYRKWGDVQTCKAGDWLLNNDGDVYTVDRETFGKTYRSVGPGIYVKDAPIWAEVAEREGQIKTKEGVTHYAAGDYIVYNDAEGQDGYAMTPGSFRRMYETAS